MFFAVAGSAVGQNVKNHAMIRYMHAKVLTAIPKVPGKCHGPQVSCAPLVLVSSLLLLETEAFSMPPVQRR